MRLRKFLPLAAVSLLTSCSLSADADQAADVLHSVKTTAAETIEAGENVVTGVTQGVTEMKRRADQVKDGAVKIKEGATSIREGIGFE